LPIIVSEKASADALLLLPVDPARIVVHALGLIVKHGLMRSRYELKAGGIFVGLGKRRPDRNRTAEIGGFLPKDLRRTGGVGKVSA
jgi:hypothetical protein